MKGMEGEEGGGENIFDFARILVGTGVARRDTAFAVHKEMKTRSSWRDDKDVTHLPPPHGGVSPAFERRGGMDDPKASIIYFPAYDERAGFAFPLTARTLATIITRQEYTLSQNAFTPNDQGKQLISLSFLKSHIPEYMVYAQTRAP